MFHLPDGLFQHDFRIFKLIEPTKFVTTGLPEMVTEIFLTMNQKAYEELSGSEKAALDKLTGEGLSLRASKGLENFGKKALGIFGKGKNKQIIIERIAWPHALGMVLAQNITFGKILREKYRSLEAQFFNGFAIFDGARVSQLEKCETYLSFSSYMESGHCTIARLWGKLSFS